MFEGLRHHPVVGRDHQKGKIDAAGTRQHRMHEAFMSRHIDEAENVAPSRSAYRQSRDRW